MTPEQEQRLSDTVEELAKYITESIEEEAVKTAAVCKAAICDDEAEGRMMTACEKINSLKDAPPELRIAHAEIYIKYIKKAQAEADKLVMDSEL